MKTATKPTPPRKGSNAEVVLGLLLQGPATAKWLAAQSKLPVGSVRRGIDNLREFGWDIPAQKEWGGPFTLRT